MEIKILEIRPVPGNRPLKAYATVQIGEMVIHDWRIIKQDGQRAWVSVPQVSWWGEGKKLKYKPLLSLPGELK